MIIKRRSREGLGATLNYYEMPDATTQAILAARGDTIKIVPDTRQIDAQIAEGWLPEPPPPVQPMLAPVGPLDTEAIIANQVAAATYEDQVRAYRAALNATYDRAAYDAYMASVESGKIPTSAGQAVVVAAPAVQPTAVQTQQGYVASVSFVNLNGTPSSFKVGDRWTLKVKGQPNSPVKVVGGKDGATATTVMGTTGANGEWSTSGTMGAGEIGNWVEDWYVGGVSAGRVTFSVAAGGASIPSSTAQPTGTGLPGIPKVLTDEAISGYPNWMIAAAVILGIILVNRN